MKRSDVYSGAALVVVDSFEAKASEDQLPEYWENDLVKPVRRNAKAYFIRKQKRCCCYCKQRVSSKNFKVWDVEHVLPRSSNPAFMFEPQNLAVSCPDCNTAKSNKKISKSKNYKRFPRSSNSYTIVHPHFDSYEDNIHVVGYIYSPKTLKGKETIIACDLLRFAERFIDWENPVQVAELDADLSEVAADSEKLKKLLKYAATL